MNRQWNKDINKRLKDFPQKAPEGLLEDIKSEMLRRGLSTVPVSNPNRQVYPTVIRRIAATAAILLILSGLAYQWLNHPLTPEVQETNLLSQQAEEPAMDDNRQPKAQPTAHIPSLRPKRKPEEVHQPDTLLYKEEESADETGQIREKEEKEQEQTAPFIPSGRQRKGPTLHRRPKKTAPLTAGIYYSDIVAQGNLNFLKSGNELPITNNAETPRPPELLNMSPENDLTLSHTPMKEKVHHHQPLRFGVSIRYSLNERWSLQSGLTYSYLVSDISKSNQHLSFRTKQKLHYVGIPLQGVYRFWEKERFRSYIAAGGQMEKQVSGKASTDYSVDGKHQSTSTEDVHDNRLLFSVLGSIGAEYELAKDFSIYAEPGIHYYFKNGNGLKTHYNEQPLNFHITVGFRFHWNR